MDIANKIQTDEKWGWMDCDLVWGWRNIHATDYTEIDGNRVTMGGLEESLTKEGLISPLELRIYLEPHTGLASIRLEKGNHRIQILYEKKIPKIPVVVEIARCPVGHLGNGVHLFNLDINLLKSGVKNLPFGKYSPEEIFN